MTLAAEFPPFPLGQSSTISWMCNEIFLVLKVNYSLVLISFCYSWYTSSNSPFLSFLSSEVLSLSQLHSQLYLQKLNVFRDCKSLFKSGETAVTCRSSQYFVTVRNDDLQGWGEYSRQEKIPDTHFFKPHTQQVAYSAIGVLASFQIHIQLHANMLSIVSPLKISALITPRFLSCAQNNCIYLPWVYITILPKTGAKFLPGILNSSIISPICRVLKFTFTKKITYKRITAEF